jgi:hypothetical protein
MRVLSIGWGVLGWCLCIVQYTAGRVRLEICLDVTTSVCVCYMQFQRVGRRGGISYCNWTLANAAEPYINVSAVWLHDPRHILSHHMHLIKSPPIFIRHNNLGAACAKDLVKGDWPELQLLDMRWG